MDRTEAHEHLPGLLGSVGKSLAHAPQAKETVAELKRAETRKDFMAFLTAHDTSLGVDKPARDAIMDAARDEAQWRETHAQLLRSAEQQLIERFSSSA